MRIKLSEVQVALVDATRLVIRSQVEAIDKAKLEVAESWKKVLDAIGRELGVTLPNNTRIVDMGEGDYVLDLPDEDPKETEVDEEITEGPQHCEAEEVPVLSEA